MKTEQPGALLTDFYQLAMMQAYREQDMLDTAVFELYFRNLPARRNFLVAAGLESALEFLENLRFTDAELAWVARQGSFSRSFVNYLAELRFTGDVYAVPEGVAIFPDEPILQVVAPLPQAQLVESRLINILHFQTLIASKAVRSVIAARGKLLVDFGMRRAHGSEAAIYAARASYIAGFSGTATILAGSMFDIPVYGTMAHSFIEAHMKEEDAFNHFARSFPGRVVLLIDTYDTEEGARKVVALAPQLAVDGITVSGVRLDSGNLEEHARNVRSILDEGGLKDTTIFVSSGIDEDGIQALLDAGAPIDGFGVGTRMDTSADVPYVDCAYKLQEYAGRPCRKLSEGKATWPGRKQVYRRHGGSGELISDLVTLKDDRQEGTPLLQRVMRGGLRLSPPMSTESVRDRTSREMSCLPDQLRSLDPAPPYAVEIAPALRQLAQSMDADAY